MRRRAGPPQKYIVCNADEGDSGTFADRMLMEGDPFTLIEGMAIAGARRRRDQGLRLHPLGISRRHRGDDGGDPRRARRTACSAPSLLGSGRAFDMEVRVGAGAYVCGEETSLLELARGQARHRARQAAAAGAAGLLRPAHGRQQRHLARHRARDPRQRREAYADFGLGRSRGTIPLQIAGNVKHGGLFETRLRHDPRRDRRRHRRRHRVRAARSRRCRSAGRSGAYFPRVAVRHALRLRGVRRRRAG